MVVPVVSQWHHLLLVLNLKIWVIVIVIITWTVDELLRLFWNVFKFNLQNPLLMVQHNVPELTFSVLPSSNKTNQAFLVFSMSWGPMRCRTLPLNHFASSPTQATSTRQAATLQTANLTIQFNLHLNMPQ